MSEIINFTRLTTSDKISDKFVTCQAYIPQDRDQAQMGQIFSHIEILSPWFPTSQIGQTIINTLIKEYYRGNDTSDLVNFEEAVKKVNEALAQAAQNGETEWIGKLSGVLVLVNNSEINFAQTGSSHSYLYRSGKVNHITEGLENEDAPHPLKTFSNLTSGTLSEDDKVIIANNAFFEIISPTELKTIISSLPPALAAIESAKILQNHGTQDANAIFLELTTKEKLANLLPEQKIEAVYLDQQILTLSALSRNALVNIGHSLGKALKASSGKISNFSHEKIAPLAKKGIDFSKEKSAQAIEKTRQMAQPKTAPMTDNEKAEDVLPKKTISSKGLKENIVTWLLKTKNKSRRFLIHVGVNTREKSKIYLSLLIGVAIILTLTIFLGLNHKKNAAKAADQQNAYNQIVALSGQADVLLTSNSQNAITKYSQVIELSKTLNGSKYFDQAKSLVDKANTQIDSVSKLTHLDALTQTEIKNATSITLNDKNVFAFSPADLYSKDLTSGTFNKVASLGVEITNPAYASDLNMIAALSKNKLVCFDPSGNNLKSSDVSLSKPSNIKAFGSNIYISDTVDNQVYKLSYADGTFSSKSSYFKDPVDVASLTDLAIDGSVYTLSNKGLIARYSRGSKVNEFQIELPTGQKIDSFLGLLTSESSLNLIVVAKINSSYRLIELRKSGDFVKQYQLNGIDQIKSAVGDKTNSNIYVLSNDKVFEFKID